jgi:hypothetical protein
MTESEKKFTPEENKDSRLKPVYELLNAKSPLEMSNLYSVEDQRLMKSDEWDYDNPELITNKVKALLEQINPGELTEEEAEWRNEVLWFWYHHAISDAIRKGDQAAAQNYADTALKMQPEEHPNKITKLLYLLVHDNLPEAERCLEEITEEPEKSTAQDLVSHYKTEGFFKKD